MMAEAFNEKRKRSVEKFLAELDLPNSENQLNFANFQAICTAIFSADEIKRNEYMLRDIFGLFDYDGDGVLKERERKIFYDWLQVLIEPVNALLVVDVQNDFIDGTLALRRCDSDQDGFDVVEPVNRLIKRGSFDKIVYSLDWHPENHISFFENLNLRKLHPDSMVTKENARPFDTVLFSEPRVQQKLWPRHCVMDTWGAELHKDLIIAPDSVQVRKGQNPEMEAYSVFIDSNSVGSMELQTILREAGVTHLYVCGLAYDVCVKATCLEGLRLGYALAVIDDCCRGVNADNIEDTKRLISENGGLITNSDDILSFLNGEKRSLIMSHQCAKAITSISNLETSANNGTAT